MKRIVAAIALTLFSVALAPAQDNTTVILPAKNGKVTFPHKKHQDMMKCTTCHENEKGGKIASLGKEWAHKTCKGCHEEKKQGPTKCGECHKK